MLVAVKGPHTALDIVVRQDRPVPGKPCDTKSDDALQAPTKDTFHSVFPTKLPALQV